MPLSQEIERLVVTFVGNIQPYLRSLQVVLRQTRMAASKIDLVGLSLAGQTMQQLGKQGIQVAQKAASNWQQTAEAMERTIDLSKLLGMQANELVAWEHAGALAGLAVNSVTSAVQRLNLNLNKAASFQGKGMLGTKFGNVFNQLGIKPNKLIGLSGTRQLEVVASKLNQIENSGIKLALAQRLFGPSGMKMLQILEKGGQALAAATKEAKELGLTYTKLGKDSVTRALVATRKLSQSIAGLATQMAIALAPAIEWVSNRITKLVSSITQWIVKHQTLTKWLVSGLFLVTMFASGILILGGTVAVLTASLGGLKVALNAVSWAIRGVAAALTFASAHPMVALISLIAAAIVATAYWTGLLGKLQEAIKSAFGFGGSIPVPVSAEEWAVSHGLPPTSSGSSLGLESLMASSKREIDIQKDMLNELRKSGFQPAMVHIR